MGTVQLVHLDLGRAPYGRALDLQRRLVERIAAEPGGRAYLVTVEHDPPVITLGRAWREEHIVAPPERLAELGVEVHHASRGGDVTWHGPGQLVAYPIIHLPARGAGLRGYLRDLEAAVIRLLARFGIDGQRINGLAGVWVGDEKIASVGVAVRRGVTYHGLAINVAADLSGFDLIVPCGLRGRGVTSIERMLRVRPSTGCQVSGQAGRAVTVEQVKAPLVECLAERLGFDAVRQGDLAGLAAGARS